MDKYQERLGIPDEVAKIVQHQVSSFNNFTPGYIVNHYKIGESDLLLKFDKDKIGIVKNQELFESRKLVEIRCKLLSSVIADLYEVPEYKPMIDELNFIVPVCLSDKSDVPLQHIPSLVFSKERYSNNILIPSVNSLAAYREYDFVDASDRPLFHKEDKMCLAASLTNIYWNGQGIEANQRLQVGDLAAKNPDKFFCRIMKPPKFGDTEWLEVCDKVHGAFPDLYCGSSFTEEEEKVSLEDQLKYKFQLCVDGHTCAWARLPWQLRSNSVTIKVRNPYEDFVEWFYYLLDPSKHFLEVDLHRLTEAYDYIVHEPEHQLALSQAGREFSDRYLSVEVSRHILLYTLLLLNQRQSLKIEN